MEKAEIGVLGGTGNYDPKILENIKEIKAYTPYGAPSSKIFLGELNGRRIAFIARHGMGHVIPPGKINYRANLWAFKELGVKRVISPSACGGLQPGIKRGDFVISNQLFDRTKQRNHSFHEGGLVCHVAFADPFCPELRKIVIESCGELNLPFHEKGIYVCMEGPHFSTRAESNFYQKMGFDIIGMTAYSEAVLARELGMCFVNIGMVTDTDVHGEEVVTVDVILKTLKNNVEKSRNLIYSIIPKIQKQRNCPCKDVLKTALI